MLTARRLMQVSGGGLYVSGPHDAGAAASSAPINNAWNVSYTFDDVPAGLAVFCVASAQTGAWYALAGAQFVGSFGTVTAADTMRGGGSNQDAWLASAILPTASATVTATIAANFAQPVRSAVGLMVLPGFTGDAIAEAKDSGPSQSYNLNLLGAGRIVCAVHTGNSVTGDYTAGIDENFGGAPGAFTDGITFGYGLDKGPDVTYTVTAPAGGQCQSIMAFSP
jgi:hypothetical protein